MVATITPHCVTEIMPRIMIEVDEYRMRLQREDPMIPDFVTHYEQDLIDLTSTYAETYATEAGRRFVEKNSRIINGDDFRNGNDFVNGDLTSRVIMWPTHPPRKSESFNGDFGSDVNWIFALYNPVNQGSTQNVGAVRVVITGSLYPIADSSRHSKLFSSVIIEEPSRYLLPKGEVLRAAAATIDAMCAERRSKCFSDRETLQKAIYLGAGPLFFTVSALYYFCFHAGLSRMKD